MDAYKIIRDEHEFSLVYKKLISNDTAPIVAERFEEKMSAGESGISIQLPVFK